jgi:hypothetical protein
MDTHNPFANITLLKEHFFSKNKINFILGTFDNDNNFVNTISKEKHDQMFKQFNSKFQCTVKNFTMMKDNNIYLFLGNDNKVTIEKEIVIHSIITSLPGFNYGFTALVTQCPVQKTSNRKFSVKRTFNIKRNIFKYKMWSFELLTVNFNNDVTYMFEMIFDNEKIDTKLDADYYIKSAVMKMMDFSEKKC